MNNGAEGPPEEKEDENAVFDFRDDEEEFEEDEDEADNEQLETGLLQKLLSPIYIVILIAFFITATIPFLILYTFGWTAWQASK